MSDLDQINARLDTIERMLSQLLQQQPQAVQPGPVSDIRTEIAQVRAAGGDLVAHFKAKGRRALLAASSRDKEKRDGQKKKSAASS